MARILNVVFSFNRGPLLANCVKSIRRFDPGSQIVVLDDDSDDPETRRVLERIAKTDGVVLETGATDKAHHGNLYANMNRAVKLAAARGFDLVHFIQDDMQLVWRRPDLAEHVEAIFESDERAYQVQVHFVKRLGKSEVEPARKPRAYRVRTIGGDLGVFHVRRILERGLEFGPSEREWAERAARLGGEVYATADPVIARIPWPRSARFGQMRGSTIRARSDLLLRPLDASAVRGLVSRDPVERPWGEDWIAPWGWSCWQPYHHDASVAGWLQAIARAAWKQRSLRGLWPRRVIEPRVTRGRSLSPADAGIPVREELDR